MFKIALCDPEYESNLTVKPSIRIKNGDKGRSLSQSRLRIQLMCARTENQSCLMGTERDFAAYNKPCLRICGFVRLCENDGSLQSFIKVMLGIR